MRESYIPIRARKDMHYFSHITFAEFRYSVDAMGYAILVCCRNESKKHEWKRNQWLKPKREMETGRAERRVCVLYRPQTSGIDRVDK